MPMGTSYSAPVIPAVSQQQTDGILTKIYRLLNLPEWMHLSTERVAASIILIFIAHVIYIVTSALIEKKLVEETLKHKNEYFEKLRKAFPNVEIPEE